MSEQPEASHQRDWQDCLPWLILFKAVRPAISLRVLLLASIGLVGMVAGWRICWNLLAYVPDESGVMVLTDPVLGQIGGQHEGTVPPWPWEDSYRTFGDQGVLASLSGLPYIGPVIGTAAGTAAELTLPFQVLFSQGLTYRGLAYALLCSSWALVVWGYFGGMITRIASVKLTQDEMVSFKAAGKFARRRWCSYMSAPLLPILGVFALAVPIALLGFFSHLDVGVLVTGILWPLVLLIGLLMTILLLGLLFGWALMWSTISTEGTDSFDAISRAYAYVFQRPFYFLFYALVATLVGALGWVLLHGIIDLVVYCTHWGLSWGLSSARMIELSYGRIEGDGVAGWGYGLIQFWQGVLRTFTTAFAVSFLWCGATAVYLLLRRQVDGVELDEVELDEEDGLGLPALETDAAGSVSVAEGEGSSEQE